jgi:hypothetical protein
MSFCIPYSDYLANAGLYELVFGPFETPCGVCDVVTPASVLLRFNGGTPAGVVSEFDDLGQPVLFEDLEFTVLNESFGGVSAPGLVRSIEYLGPNLFLVLIDPSYTPSPFDPASFQIRLDDPRYSCFNSVYTFADSRAYVSNERVRRPVYDLVHEPITMDTLEYLVGWNERHWAARLSGEPLEDFSPPHPGQISASFNSFDHALYEIQRVNHLGDLELEDLYAYVDSHLAEFRQYTTDLALAVRFFIDGFPKAVDLDSVGALTSVDPPNMLLRGLNPFGVQDETYKCMTRDPPRGKGPLYKTTRMMSEISNYIPWSFGQRDFDCRSFAESMCVFLRQQLIGFCEQATVGIYRIPGHVLNYVDLGGDPKPCCEGVFIIEPQTGDVYTEDEYRTENGLWWNGKKLDPSYSYDGIGWPYQPTDWASYPEELDRISGILCSCVDNAIAGTAEATIKGQCEAGTASQWLVDNYNYGSSTQNGPGNGSPAISGMPQIFGCDLYKCGPVGCLKNQEGRLREYDCRFCPECFLGDNPDLNVCVDDGWDLLNVQECECGCFDGRSYETELERCVDDECLGLDGRPCHMTPCHECDGQGECVYSCEGCQECVDGSCQNRPICNGNQYLKSPECECLCFSAETNGCLPPKVQTGGNCDCVCVNPPSCSSNKFLNDQCECACFSAEVNGCLPPKVQTGDNCDCVCANPPTCEWYDFINDQCECNGCPKPARPTNCPDACVQTTEGFDGCLIMYCSDEGPECKECDEGFKYSQSRKMCVTDLFYCT